MCVKVTPGVSSNQSENRITQAEGETERGRRMCSSECEHTMLCHRATDNNQAENAAARDVPF